jgi:hypothetical protein
MVRGWRGQRDGSPFPVGTAGGGGDLIAEIGVDTLPDLDRVLGTVRSIDGIRSGETSILLASR